MGRRLNARGERESRARFWWGRLRDGDSGRWGRRAVSGRGHAMRCWGTSARCGDCIELYRGGTGQVLTAPSRPRPLYLGSAGPCGFRNSFPVMAVAIRLVMGKREEQQKKADTESSAKAEGGSDSGDHAGIFGQDCSRAAESKDALGQREIVPKGVQERKGGL